MKSPKSEVFGIDPRSLRKEMVIMGIDPGVATLGIAFATYDGQVAKHLYHGIIRTRVELPLERRLSEIYYDVTELCHEYHPKLICMEEFFMPRFAKNASGFNTSKSIGAIMAVAGRKDIPVQLYPAPVVKDAACGKSKADKQEVMAGVADYFGLDEVKPSHAADALAVILCHVKGKKDLNFRGKPTPSD